MIKLLYPGGSTFHRLRDRFSNREAVTAEQFRGVRHGDPDQTE
jgi:hypothetical protein